MSMGLEYYIGNSWYGPPWYVPLLVIFIFLVVFFGLGFLEKLVIDFWCKWHERKNEVDISE
jgi:hypothetical protein